MMDFPPEILNWFFGLFITNIGSVLIAYVKIVERLAILETNVKTLMIATPKRKDD